MFFVSHYFDHDAFMHHTLHVLDAPACIRGKTFFPAAYSARREHRRRLGGSPTQCARPSIFEKRPCIYQFLPHFPPKFGFAPPICLTSISQWKKRSESV